MKQVPNLLNRNAGLMANYGLTGLLSLAKDALRTRIFYPGCRLLRSPLYVRGRRWIVFGPRFNCGRGLRMDALGNAATSAPLIRIGADVAMNDYVHIGAVDSISIGDRVLIGSKVLIIDHDHGSYGRTGIHSDPRTPPDRRELVAAPIVIDDDVWIGEFVCILAGVHVGKGSIIGAMSTVTRDVPPYCLAVGSPARIVKRFNLDTAQWERV